MTPRSLVCRGGPGVLLVPIMSSTHEDVRDVPRAMEDGVSGRGRGCAVGMRVLSEGPWSRVTGVLCGASRCVFHVTLMGCPLPAAWLDPCLSGGLCASPALFLDPEI